MYLLESWKESLTLFLPKNFKLFILVTVRAISIALKDFFSSLWWLFLLVIALQVLLDIWLLGNMRTNVYLIVWALTVLISTFVSLLLYLSTRPSITLKNCAYYGRYSWYVIYFLVLLVSILLFLLGLSFLPSLVDSALSCLLTLGNPLTSIFVLFVFFVSPLIVFSMLFLLDSDGTPSSFVFSLARGVKMLFYNYPFCFICFLFFAGFHIVLTEGYYLATAYMNVYEAGSLSVLVAMLVVNRALFLLLYIVGGLIPLTFFTNFYIKRVHEQFKLYFKKS